MGSTRFERTEWQRATWTGLSFRVRQHRGLAGYRAADWQCSRPISRVAAVRRFLEGRHRVARLYRVWVQCWREGAGGRWEGPSDSESACGRGATDWRAGRERRCCDGAVVRQVVSTVRMPSGIPRQRLQEGAAPSAFEKRTESEREGHLSRRRQCVSAALGQRAMAMAHMSLRWRWCPCPCLDGASALALGGQQRWAAPP
jgi:hypothetical protein